MHVAFTSRAARRLPVALLAAAVVAGVGAATAADVPAGLVGSGVAVAPADAAFFSATLRAREQYDRFARSNAYAALRSLPVVKRALDSLEEQRTMPGSPLSMADTFLQLPENSEALDVIADMVATDTFVYGEPSCTAFVKLVRKLWPILQSMGVPGDGIIIDEEMDVFEDADDGGEAAVRRPARRMRCQFGDDFGDAVPVGTVQSRMLVQTLVDNLDLVVMPDVVWGFRTTKAAAAKGQIARLEGLARAATAGDPDTADMVARRRVAGGDFLVLTVRGDSLPWGEIESALEDDAGDIDGFAELFARLRKIDLCVALGVVGDRVILSIGDSTDHLGKLAGPKPLVSLPALAPVAASAERPLTAVSYVSAELARATAQSADDLEQQIDMLEEGLDAAGGIPDELVEGVRGVLERFVDAQAGRLPEPGARTGFSYLTDGGYEGYAWDWSRNQPFDGGRRLDLLEHAGGAPLAVLVARLRSDPKAVGDVADLVTGLWSVLQQHGLPVLDGEVRDRAEEFADRFGPLAARLTAVVRDKLVAAVADGQVGLVLDAKSRTRKPQQDLPSSADPLPLPEAAIVLPLKDAKLFRDGLSDLFEIGDAAVKALREIEPDAVPGGALIPDPERSKVEGGTVWAFALPGSGLDGQVRPAIGVGDKAAVFALAPRQAARLLGAVKLETGAQVSAFEEPLAQAAAVDVAGLVDALKPWVVYLTRYGCVREREGAVEADAELRADDETEEARDALRAVDVVLEVAKCLRAAVAETSLHDGVAVTHWRNVIRDLPKRP